VIGHVEGVGCTDFELRISDLVATGLAGPATLPIDAQHTEPPLDRFRSAERVLIPDADEIGGLVAERTVERRLRELEQVGIDALAGVQRDVRAPCLPSAGMGIGRGGDPATGHETREEQEFAEESAGWKAHIRSLCSCFAL
jgi:hypothetical protein